MQLVFLALSFFTLPIPQDGAQQAPRLEERSFDLPFVRQSQGPVSLKLVPYDRLGISDFRPEREPMETLAADQVLEMVRNTITPESWESNGAALSVSSDGSLRVRGAPEQLSQVEALLTYLSTVLLHAQDLDVEVYPVLDGQRPLGDAPALLDAPSAKSTIQGLRESGALAEPRAWTMRTFPTLWARSGGQRSVVFVRDLDVEIGQTAGQADPWVDTYLLGTITHVRTSPGAGGCLLHLLFEHGETLGEVTPKALTARRELYIESGKLVESTNEMLAIQPKIGFGTLACVTFVPDDRELLFVERVQCPTSNFGRLLRIKPRPRPRSETPLVLELGDTAFAIRDVSALTAPNFAYDGRLGPALLARGQVTGRSSADMGSDTIAEPPYHSESLRRLLAENATDPAPEIEIYAGLLILQGSKSRIEETLRTVDALEARTRATHGLRVELRNRQGTRTLAEVALSTCENRSAFFSLGSDGLGVLDHDVEVAQGSMMCDPVIDGVAHGILGQVRVQRLGERLVVDLELGLHWMRSEIQSTPIPGWPGSYLDLYDGLYQTLREKLILGPGEATETGDLDPGSEEGLVLRVARN